MRRPSGAYYTHLNITTAELRLPYRCHDKVREVLEFDALDIGDPHQFFSTPNAGCREWESNP